MKEWEKEKQRDRELKYVTDKNTESVDDRIRKKEKTNKGIELERERQTDEERE